MKKNKTMKDLTILLLLFSIIFSSELIFAEEKTSDTQQEVIELRKNVKYFMNKCTQYDSIIVNQQQQIKELKIEKKLFSTIVSSQWNIFSTIITVIIGFFTIIISIASVIAWKNFFKDIPNIQKRIDVIVSDISSLNDNISDIKLETSRALYYANFYTSKYLASAIIATRNLSYYTDNKQYEKESYWLIKLMNSLQKNNYSLRSEMKDEITRTLKKIKVNSDNSESEGTFLTAKQMIDKIEENNKTI